MYIETFDNQQILTMNEEARRMLGDKKKSLKIQDYFDHWNVCEESMISAAVDGIEMIFLMAKKTDGTHAYAGIVSGELDSLTMKVREMERLNRHLDAVIENSYDGIYITDKNGITLRTNSAIERITNIPKEYYINKRTEDLVKRGILEDSVTKKVLEKKRTVSVMQLNYLGRETLLTGNPVFNDEGEIESVVTNIRDLSDLNQLHKALEEANELNQDYRKEIERLRDHLAQLGDWTIIKADRMIKIYEMAARIANADATVILYGETGVGKDVLAKYLYQRSERSKSGKYIKINCGALPSELLESELFGYASGAFTGANKSGKQGLFEMADKGVLFLDEVGEMSMALQVKLLRVLQDKEIQRVGGTVTKKVDVRIIAATNRDLRKMVDKGEFREDLFYRLNVVPITIPPLRERREEILPLADLSMRQCNEKYGTYKQLNKDLKAFLYQYSWPGNIRELANLIERITLLHMDDVLGLEHLPAEYQPAAPIELHKETAVHSLKEAAELAERKALSLAAEKYHSTYEMAEALQTSQPTIVRKLKKYKIELG